MQKARALRYTEWALEDALRMIQTNSDVPPNIGYQRDPHKIITTMNRDRPGGHKLTELSFLPWWAQDGISKKTRAGLKRQHKRKARQEQKKHTKECLQDQWDDLFEIEYHSEDYDDGWNDYRDEYGDEPDYDWTFDDPWDGYDDPYWDYEFGYDYDDYNRENHIRERNEYMVGEILSNLLNGNISKDHAKKQIMDFL